MSSLNGHTLKAYNSSPQLKEVLMFFIKLTAVYLTWRIFSIVAGAEAQPINERIWPAMSAVWEGFNDLLKENLVFFSRWVLGLMGYNVEQMGNNIVKVVGYGGVGIGNYCLAVELFVLFVALVASYPAPTKTKLWFIPLGLLSIHLLNVVRVIALNLLTVYAPEYADFNHHFTFRVIVFLYILLLYNIFLKHFADKPKTKKIGQKY